MDTKKRIIMNADDYGHTPGISAGIRHAHLQGIVTSTTVMMNRPDAVAAVCQALEECPRLGLGVHLVATSGAPLLPVSRVKSITGGSENFPGLAAQIARISEVDPLEVQAEWSVQIEKFVETAGRAPDHLDSHHHFSYFTPPIFRVMLELARDYNCPIRLPDLSAMDEAISDLTPEMVQAMREGAPALMEEFKPRHPDYFSPSFYDETATKSGLKDLLANLPPGAAEIMCHPGYVDQDLLARSIYNLQRETEIEALTDPEIVRYISEQHIELISFAQL